MFLVVEFIDTKELAVVPLEWLSSESMEQCLWPPCKTDQGIKKLAKNHAMPDNSWKEYRIRQVGKKIFDKVHDPFKLFAL